MVGGGGNVGGGRVVPTCTAVPRVAGTIVLVGTTVVDVVLVVSAVVSVVVDVSSVVEVPPTAPTGAPEGQMPTLTVMASRQVPTISRRMRARLPKCGLGGQGHSAAGASVTVQDNAVRDRVLHGRNRAGVAQIHLGGRDGGVQFGRRVDDQQRDGGLLADLGLGLGAAHLGEHLAHRVEQSAGVAGAESSTVGQAGAWTEPVLPPAPHLVGDEREERREQTLDDVLQRRGAARPGRDAAPASPWVP